MAGFRVTEAADLDIDEIYATIKASGGRRAAESFNRNFDALFVRLTEFPESGAPRPSLGDRIRIGVVRPYIVIYRYEGSRDLVEVLRIVHGRRNILSQLLRL